MTHHTKHLTTTLTTIALLALAVTTASANRLSINHQDFRATWTSLRLTNTISAGTVLCPVTLEGSFHSATISKVNNALVGYVTRASVRGGSSTGECTGGTATIHGETLPWHIRYRGFSGTLPRITSIVLGLARVSFEIHDNISGDTCTAVTEELHLAIGSVKVSESTGIAESLTPEPNTRIPLRNGAGGIFCGLANGIFGEESQTLTQLGSTARIEVTLIGGIPGHLEPSPVAFGRIEPSQLALRTVTIVASSEGFTVNGISMERAEYFAITDPNRCVGTRLGERARCSFKTVFVPPAEAERRLEDRITVETTRETLTDIVRGET